MLFLNKEASYQTIIINVFRQTICAFIDAAFDNQQYIFIHYLLLPHQKPKTNTFSQYYLFP